MQFRLLPVLASLGLLCSAALLRSACAETKGTKLTHGFFDMGTPASPVERDHTRVTESTVFDPDKGYGWLEPAGGSFDRPDATPPSDLKRDGVHSKDKLVFRILLKPGNYYLRVIVGDPAEHREKMSIYILDRPLAGNLTTQATWWRGEATSLVIAGTVGIGGDVMDFQFYHDGTANSVQAIQVLPESTSLFDPGQSSDKLPDLPDLPLFESALKSYRNRNFTRSAGEIDKVFKPGTDFLKAWLLTWIAGRLDYSGNSVELLRKANNYLQSATLKDPTNFAARKRLLQNQDFLIAKTYLEPGGYTDLREKTGAGWGERRKVARNVLSQIQPGDPLYYHTLLELGRVSYWVGQKADSPQQLAAASRYFRQVQRKFPSHPLARMYLGEKLPWGEEYAERIKGAPDWALRQREALARLNDIMRYWIDERQVSTGEFGGGWGDDVEMMRWWHAAALATGNDKITQSMKRLADGIWNQSGIIENGFFRGLTEVQYAAEPTADTQPALVGLLYGSPTYVERCMESARLMGSLWTAINPKGHRLFRSVDLGSRRVGDDTKRAVDLPYHVRALLPAQWAGWYNRNPEVTRLFREWAETWLAAARRSDKGKPEGILPAALTFATEELGGYGTPWYNPKLGPPYYNFPGGLDLLFGQLIATYQLTGEDKYLAPIESALSLLLESTNGHEMKGEVGGRFWVARVLVSTESMKHVWDKWRILTGKTDYDGYLKRYGSSYIKWFLSGDKKHLTDGCKEAVSSIGWNLPLLTSEVRYTDRVKVVGTSHLLAMATGGPGLPGTYPVWKVTWQTDSRNLAILVLPDRDERAPIGEQKGLRALVRNFEADPIQVRMRLWALMPGSYELVYGPDSDGDDRMDYEEDQAEFEVYGRGAPVELELPGQNLMELVVRQLEPFEGLEKQRPDLAVDSGCIHVFPVRPVSGERVFIGACVHNIGSAKAPDAEATLSMGAGPAARELSAVTLSGLRAPNDLKPSREWIWSQSVMGEEGFPVSVRATIPDAGPGLEMTTENNEATREVSVGAKGNPEFARVFWQGRLSDPVVPVWVELARIFEGENRAPLARERADELRALLRAANARAGDQEKRMIRSLESYIDELAAPKK